MDKKLSNILGGMAFYGSLAVCLIAVGLGGWFWLFGQKETGQAAAPEQQLEADVPASAAAQIPPVPQEPEEVLPPTVAVVQEPTTAVVMPEEIVAEVTEEPEVPVMAQAPQITVEPLI